MGARKKRYVVTYDVPIMVYVEATNPEKAEALADEIYYDQPGLPGVWTALDGLFDAINKSIGREDRSVTLGVTYDDADVSEQK